MAPVMFAMALLQGYAQDSQSKSDAVPVEMLESDKKQFSGDKLKKVEDGIRKARKTVCRLDLPGGGGSGSGVVIKWKGKIYFVSVAHNFGKGVIKTIDMPGPLKLDESEFTVEKIAIDKGADVSAFRITNPREGMAYAEVNEKPDLSKGTAVLLLTYPMGRGLKKGFPVHDAGLIESVSSEIFARDVYISHSAGSPDGEKVTIGPGSSGGGMFDLDGRLIAIVRQVRGSKAQGQVGAVPVSKALALIKD